MPLNKEIQNVRAALPRDYDWRARKSDAIDQLLNGAPLPAILETLCRRLQCQIPASCCGILGYDVPSSSYIDTVGTIAKDFHAELPVSVVNDWVAKWRMQGNRSASANPFKEGAKPHPCVVLPECIPARGGSENSLWVAPVVNGQQFFYAVVVLIVPKSHEHARLPQLLHETALLASMVVNHHQAQDLLRITEIVYEASQNAIIVTDSKNRIVSVNPAFTKITGYHLDDVKGHSPKVLSSKQHPPEFYQTMWRTIHDRGAWSGEVCNRKKNGELYYEWLNITKRQCPDGTIEGYVGIFTDISDLKQAQKTISYQASHDTHSGLLNKRSCMDVIARMRQDASHVHARFAVLCIGIDGFREYSHTMSHADADELLMQVVQRLQTCVHANVDGKQDSVLGRIGLDEFLIVTSVGDAESAIAEIADKVIHEIDKTFDIESSSLHLTACIGIALYPDDCKNASLLLNRASEALHEAKRIGRCHSLRYSPAFSYTSNVRAQLKVRLKEALQRHQLSLYYQPIIDARDGTPIKAEALLRWNHPDLGQISPAIFIPMAEEIGVIDKIGLWVLRQSLRHMKERQLSGCGKLIISINLSPFQLASPDFMDAVAKAFDDSGLPAECITFEITEGVMMDDRHDCSGIIKALKQRGASIALDDFGTGYSSLSYIKKYDIDYIKIDRTFVNGIDHSEEDRILVEAMLVMADKLGIKVIVEGVETESQLNVLKQIGAYLIQGYCFSKPMPHAEFTTWLGSHAPS